MNISHPKSFWFVFGMALFVSVSFLYFSRVPELNIKSLSSTSNIFNGLITHDPLFVLLEYDNLIKKLLKHSLNWLYANYKGMLFGIFLGGVAKNLFRYLQFKKEHGSFASAFMGLLAGSPLSVCVNCASPIMKGLLSSKQKVFALSVMFSSPSMNFIILTMLFSLLPFYLAFAKIFFNLIFILITLPLINYIIGKKITFIKANDSKSQDRFFRSSKNWLKEFKSSLKLFFEDLKFIFIRTAPLMVLASVFVSVLLVFGDNYELENLPSNFITLSITSLLGILFPVPMAIDILLVAGLFSIGVNTNIILALLFSLGISSIYSLAIVWRSLSALWAISLFFSLFLMTVLMAPMGNITEKFYIKSAIYYSGKILNTPEKKLPDKISQTNIVEKKKTRLKEAQIKKEWTLIEKQDEMSLYGQKFNEQEDPISKKFTKLEGKDIGLDKAYEPDNIDLLFPLWFRGIASADINQDGLDDLVFGSNEGPVIYKNRGGGFEPQEFSSSTNESLPDLNSLIVFLVALIDFNNDNYPDLFFTTWSDGNYLVPNINGSYDWNLAKKLPNKKALLTISASFADFDKDSFIDIVNGNTSSVIPLRSIKIDGERINSVLYNQSNFNFIEKTLKANPNGDTLSILNGDFNKDGFIDIIVSNDFEVPDFLYLNKGKTFEMSSLSSLEIEKSPADAMSYNLGDLNNDLNEDIFKSGTVYNDRRNFRPTKKYFQNKWNNKNCYHIKDKRTQNRCFEFYLLKKYHPNIDEPSYHFLKCLLLKKYSLKSDCLANNLIGIMLYQTSFFKQNLPNCNLFSNRYKVLKDICQLQFKAQGEINIENIKEEQQELRHYIYMGTNQSLFNELLSEKDGHMIYPQSTGWSWNSQIADYDNDGLQDIFIVNGSVDNKYNGPNYFLKNYGDRFRIHTFEYNLNDIFNYYSYVSIDFDNDGDLDIITNSAPIRIYKNNHSGKNSLSISFLSKNESENFISTQVILKESNGEKQFLRRVQKTGGFLSFSSNQLYFGLGKEDKERFSSEIIWPSGKKSYLKNKLKRGYKYLIIKH